MKKMKSMLLLLGALAVAAPAWAADAAPAPAAAQAAAPAAEPSKPATKKKMHKKKVKASANTMGCANGCALMQCPAGTSPSVCAKKTTNGCTTTGC